MGNHGKVQNLFNQIKREIFNAVNEAESKSYLDANRNLTASYSAASPVQYERTNQLLNSARTTGAIEVGNTVVAKIYLDQGYNYNTGTYSTPKVFSEAESGGSGIVLGSGFWEKTENMIGIHFNEALSKRFK